MKSKDTLRIRNLNLPWVALIWGILVVLYLATSGAHFWQIKEASSSKPEELPIYGTIPDLKLVESSGEEFHISDLRGKVWVATLFFTHCAATCPMMASQLAKFQETVSNPDIVLVSISVDPERDTPERLREYAKIAGAKKGRWFFLTGEKETIDKLAETYLKLGTGQAREGFSTHEKEKATLSAMIEQTAEEVLSESEEEESEEYWEEEEDVPVSDGTREVEIVNPILHSDRFVLVDQKGRIRGYYDGLDPVDRELLRSDAGFLLENDGD